MPLKQGIPINQSPPSVHRANRRPLYLMIGAAVLVALLLVWAWIVRSNMRVLAQAKGVPSSAGPAVSALQTLNKEWAEKLPKQPETLAPIVPPVPPGAPAGPAPPPGPAYDGRRMQPYPLPALSAAAFLPPVSQVPAEAPAQHQPAPSPVDEERAAWDSPMVPAGQDVSHQVSQGNPIQGPGSVAGGPPSYPYAGGRERGPGDDYLSQNLQDSKKAFAGVGRNTLLPIAADGGRIPPYVVRAGWDIPAILEQSANSDLPGELRARVRENVYDTAAGRYLLIPQNSILAGKYNSDVAYAQNRIQVNWDRLLRPGSEPTIYLNEMNGIDGAGNAGLTGPVNNHFRRLIGFALLSSAFAAGIEVSQTRNSSAFGYPTVGQTAGAAVGQQMGEFGRRITTQNLNRPPTVQLKPGTRFNVRVDRDIVFLAPWKEE